MRSIVTDIFDGALQSNVQCLTCLNVSKTKETFQDLSLPIPTSDIVTSKSDEGWVSWAWWWLSSWFYGPDVSLMNCLESFFSADELKGDNMYRCEKCKMLRNGLKYSKVSRDYQLIPRFFNCLIKLYFSTTVFMFIVNETS